MKFVLRLLQCSFAQPSILSSQKRTSLPCPPRPPPRTSFLNVSRPRLTECIPKASKPSPQPYRASNPLFCTGSSSPATYSRSSSKGSAALYPPCLQASAIPASLSLSRASLSRSRRWCSSALSTLSISCATTAPGWPNDTHRAERGPQG